MSFYEIYLSILCTECYEIDIFVRKNRPSPARLYIQQQQRQQQ